MTKIVTPEEIREYAFESAATVANAVDRLAKDHEGCKIAADGLHNRLRSLEKDREDLSRDRDAYADEARRLRRDLVRVEAERNHWAESSDVMYRAVELAVLHLNRAQLPGGLETYRKRDAFLREMDEVLRSVLMQAQAGVKLEVAEPSDVDGAKVAKARDLLNEFMEAFNA